MSGKRQKVREKSVKHQGISKWRLSGNPGMRRLPDYLLNKFRPIFPEMALCKIGHFKLVRKIAQKLLQLVA